MDIEKEILEIKERNQKVEADKSWELSFARRIAISLFTYVVAEAWFLIIHEPNSWAKAFVPVVGYILSTLSLRTIRNLWMKIYEK